MLGAAITAARPGRSSTGGLGSAINSTMEATPDETLGSNCVTWGTELPRHFRARECAENGAIAKLELSASPSLFEIERHDPVPLDAGSGARRARD